MTTALAAPASVPEADKDKKSAAIKRRVMRSPTAHYQSGGMAGSWWMAGAASLDGSPVFTFFDIPRMHRDPIVRFASSLWRAPFQKVKFTVKCGGTGGDKTDQKCATFIQNTLKRFWTFSLPKLLHRYFNYGFCVGGAETEPFGDGEDFVVRLAEVKNVEPRDAQPRVYRDGPKRGGFAGFALTNSGDPDCTFVPEASAFWFAGMQTFGRYFDIPPLMGMFEPWLEKCGRNGANHLRRVWFRKNAGRGGKLYYPPGKSQIGSDESPEVRDNQDLAREILDYGDSTSTYAFENTLHPANNQFREWELEEAEGHADIAGFLDYPQVLDKLMIQGTGIPLEVIQGSDSGSGYKGRLVSYGGFLDIVTELSGVLVKDCESWLTPLVRGNYGPEVWYEIIPVSLSEIAQEEEKRNPTGSGAIGQPLPGLPGDGSKAGGEQGASPLQLSTVSAPVRGADDATLDVLKSLAASVAALSLKALQPAPVSLSATVGPDADNPQSKQLELQKTQQKLMRSRKSTIAQLLALAMVKKQQEATAAGQPEAAAGSLQQLSVLAGDPMQVARIVGLDATELSATDWTELELATNAEEWAPGKPSRNGTPTWVNARTGERRYQENRPGEKRAKREASEKAGWEILKKVAHRTATLEEVAELETHLPVMRASELVAARRALEVNLRGERKKTQMVERLLDHIDKTSPKRAPAESRAPKKPGKWEGTVTGAVSDFGGIDPDSAALKRHYGSWKEAVQDGIPLAAFRGKDGGRGRRGLDQLAQELAENNVQVPEGADPEEHLLGLMKSGAKVKGAEGDEFEDAWKKYLADQEAEEVGKGGNKAPDATSPPAPEEEDDYFADLKREDAEKAKAEAVPEPAPAPEVKAEESAPVRGEAEPAPAPVAEAVAEQLDAPAPAVEESAPVRTPEPAPAQATPPVAKQPTAPVAKPAAPAKAPKEKAPPKGKAKSKKAPESLEAQADELLAEAGDAPELKVETKGKKRTGKSTTVADMRAALDDYGFDHSGLSDDEAVETAVLFNKALAATDEVKEALKDNANPNRLFDAMERTRAAAAALPDGPVKKKLESQITKLDERAAPLMGADAVDDDTDDERSPTGPFEWSREDEALLKARRDGAPKPKPQPAPAPKVEKKKDAPHVAALNAFAGDLTAGPALDIIEDAAFKHRADDAPTLVAALEAEIAPGKKQTPETVATVRKAIAALGAKAEPARAPAAAKGKKAPTPKKSPAPAPIPADSPPIAANPAPIPKSPAPKKAAGKKSAPVRGGEKVVAPPALAKLKSDPLADKKHLQKLVDAAPPEAKEHLETARWNAPGDKSSLSPESRRRATVERLAAAYRDAFREGAGADHIADVLGAFGAKLDGPAEGATVPFNGRLHADAGGDYGPEGVFTDTPVRVVRRPVVGPDGSVAIKGEVEPLPAPKGKKPKK